MTTIKVEKVAKAPAPAVEVDQIWMEGGDRRFERYVRIQALGVRPGKAKITTCNKVGTPVGVTSSFAKIERFNNKGNGYIFVAEKAAS